MAGSSPLIISPLLWPIITKILDTGYFIIDRNVSLIFIETGNSRVKVLEESVSGEVSLHAPDGTLWQLPSGERQGSTHLRALFMKALSFSWEETILPRPYLKI